MPQNVEHLSFSNAGKPVYKFVNGRSTSAKILKQRGNRHTRIYENPHSADSLWSSLNGFTAVPLIILSFQR